MDDKKELLENKEDLSDNKLEEDIKISNKNNFIFNIFIIAATILCPIIYVLIIFCIDGGDPGLGLVFNLIAQIVLNIGFAINMLIIWIVSLLKKKYKINSRYSIINIVCTVILFCYPVILWLIFKLL